MKEYLEAIRERKVAHRLAVIDKSYSFTTNQKTVLRTVPLGPPDLTKSRTFTLRFQLVV